MVSQFSIRRTIMRNPILIYMGFSVHQLYGTVLPLTWMC